MTAAAKLLDLQQPTISAHIQRLENECKRSINHALALDAGVDTRSAAYAAPSSMFQGSSAS